jgi:hypothetical protein
MPEQYVNGIWPFPLLYGKCLPCRRREQQTAQLRKTAEKLLLNQLKRHALRAQKASQEASARMVCLKHDSTQSMCWHI